MKEKIRILIADDNFDFVTTIVNYLSKEEDFEIVATAKDGNEDVSQPDKSTLFVQYTGKYPHAGIDQWKSERG